MVWKASELARLWDMMEAASIEENGSTTMWLGSVVLGLMPADTA